MMKKSLSLILGVAALMAASCQPSPKPQTLNAFKAEQLAAATSLEDSVIAIEGSFVGAFFHLQTERMPGDINRQEVLRGMRDVMGTDTANNSYILGLQMGMRVLNTYKELAEGTEISKEAFVRTVSEAFRLDSVSMEQFQELQPEFEAMYERMRALAQERRELAMYDSEAARENRMLAEAVVAKLQSNPEYKPAGTQGIYKKEITAGNGEVIDPQSLILVTYSLSKIGSGEKVTQTAPVTMFASRPSNEVVASVLPFMSLGETAEFYVPYELAYGVGGQPRINVGPCESLMITLTVEPKDQPSK